MDKLNVTQVIAVDPKIADVELWTKVVEIQYKINEIIEHLNK